MTAINHKDLAFSVKAICATQWELTLNGSDGREVNTVAGS